MIRGLCFSAGVLVAVAFAGCDSGSAHATRASDTPRLAVVHPRRSDAVRSLSLPGDLVGFYEATLHAKVSGYLKTIGVDKGDTVRAGTVVAEIEVPELQQKLARARAQLEIRRLRRDRLRRVWDSDRRLVAREQVDVADSEYLQARADVDEMEALVSYTHLAAPFDGIVTGRFVDPGALLQSGGGESAPKGEGSAVVRLAQISKLRVYVYVPEDDVAAIREGMPAQLVLSEYPGREFHGRVARFTHALDLSTRTMLTEVDLENGDGALYPGMYAQVRIELARHSDCRMVPATAVMSAGESASVYAVRDGRLARVPVELGMREAGWVEVQGDVGDAEQIVRHAEPSLREGEEAEAIAVTDGGGGPSTGAGE